jgi:hypothetical protein
VIVTDTTVNATVMGDAIEIVIVAGEEEATLATVAHPTFRGW